MSLADRNVNVITAAALAGTRDGSATDCFSYCLVCRADYIGYNQRGCRLHSTGLLCLKIAYACCLRMMRAGSYIIFSIQFGDNIQTTRQLRNAVFAKFFDKSYLLLINFVCYYMRYRVIYFQCLCYLALPLCIVSII